MKAQLEIVKFNIADIVATSGGDTGCSLPTVPQPVGDMPPSCTGVA